MDKLTKFSQRNLSVIENFILHFTHGEEPLSSEMTQSAIAYISEDHADGEGSEQALLEIAKRGELILEEVFMADDKREDLPCNVYADEKTKLIYCVNEKLDQVTVYKLTKPQEVIEVEYRSEILNYRLAKVTPDDEVSLGDIFMHGKYIEKV